MRKIMTAFENSADNRPSRPLDTVRLGAIAGAAGGFAEVAWVSLYAAATDTSPAILARGVTTAAGVSALVPADAVALGIGVHMTIAVALGVALAFVWRAMSLSQTVNPFAFMAAALIGVWAINFFVVLPIVSPAFIKLVPYSVSLISKVLFGLAAASAFRLLTEPALELNRARIARRAA
jgi:hypothetical protein